MSTSYCCKKALIVRTEAALRLGMANLVKITIWAFLGITVLSSVAEAIPINRCARILRDQAGRETVVNTCKACITVTVERHRPGLNNDTPSIRNYNIPSGTHQPLSFLGPGGSRIVNETACPTALGN